MAIARSADRGCRARKFALRTAGTGYFICCCTVMTDTDTLPMTSRAATSDSFTTNQWSSHVCACGEDCCSCWSVVCCWPVVFAQLWTAVAKRMNDKRCRCVTITVVIFLVYGLFLSAPFVSPNLSASAELREQMINAIKQEDGVTPLQKFAMCRVAATNAVQIASCGGNFTESLPEHLQPAGQDYVACVEHLVALPAANERTSQMAQCSASYGLAVANHAMEHVNAPSAGAIAFDLFVAFFGVLILLILCRLRGKMRKRDRIPGNCCEDLCCSWCCFYCTLCQLMRHEGLAEGRYSILSPTGHGKKSLKADVELTRA